MVCVLLPMCAGLYIYMSLCTSTCRNLSPHTLRFSSFVPYLYRLCVTSTIWLLSPGDKISSCKDGSRPTFQKRTSSGLSVDLIPDLHTSPLGYSQNCWLKPACILTNISNDISPLTVRMRYNPISNQPRVMGSLPQSNRRVWIQNPFCKVRIHLHLNIAADRGKQNIAWYECHAYRTALFPLNMQRKVSKHGLNIVWYSLLCFWYIHVQGS